MPAARVVIRPSLNSQKFRPTRVEDGLTSSWIVRKSGVQDEPQQIGLAIAAAVLVAEFHLSV